MKTQESKKSRITKSVVIKTGIITCIAILVITLFPFPLFLLVDHNTNKDIYRDIESVPAKKVAIVFGAAIWRKDYPSDVLRDRILTAVNLYNAGKVEKIIMSGDNRTVNYDEPSTMISYAMKNGVPEEALQPDYAGRRTYDTCYRARNIFNLEEAILVTQDFHLTRAIYTCNALGVKSIGMKADLMEYQNINQMQVRDIYALTLAIFDIHLRKPEVVLGEKITI